MDVQNLFGFNGWTFLTGMSSLVLGLGFLIQGCGKAGTVEEGKITVTAKADSIQNKQIPSIDRSGSLRTETATFALG